MTPEKIKTIYDRLEKLVIDLDPNPSSRGPLYLQDLIARVRGYLNETSHHLQDVLRETHMLQMNLDAEEAAYEVQSDEYLATDARVTRLPNIDDRKAMINVLMGEDRRKIQTMKRELKSLSYVEKVIRARHKELENTMSSVRMQRGIIEAEIRTGSFYGDESTRSRNEASELSEEELNSLFETPPEEKKDDVTEPIRVEEPLSEDMQIVEQFLDNDVDLTGIFDSV